MKMADRNESLPWGDNMPYLQLFQYDRSGEMTKETQVDPAKLKQALSQYCSEEIMQQAAEEDEYDGTPYWYIYDCLSRLGKGDETNVIRWNKVLRDLGFTSVYDDGGGWIAYNEPTQGVVLDPRIIKQHKMFDNRNPTLQHRRYDMQGLANSIEWSSYYQRERQLQRVPYNHPDEKKIRLDVAKSMLKPFLGKSDKEAEEMGYDQALKAAADKVIEILKQDTQGVAEAEKTAKVFHPQYVDVYYLDGPRRTPILVNRKVPYNLVDRYLELAIKKYNLQQGRFEFRNAEEEKVAEGLGIPYPTTYEQENDKFKRRGTMRITNMTEVNQDYLNEE
jgi:hypothetical protein